MTFAHPHLLYFLLSLPVLAGLRFWASWRAGRVVARMTSARLRPALVVGVSAWRSALIFALQLVALACFILAVARPRWGEDRIIQQDTGRNVIIAIDTSRSMLAGDVAPDRITRARLAAQDVLNSLKTDRVGLIAFAGNAYLQAPLTTDHEAVVEAIQSLDFTSVPRGGSEISKALKLAMETFEKNPARNHGLILFSDGGEPDAQVREYAQQAAKKNVLVLTVGVGTDGGSLIPDPDPERQGEFVKDSEGRPVKTALVSTVLQEIATLTRGRYLRLGSQPLAASVVASLISSLEAQTNAAREVIKPIERFQWPLSMGVGLLMIAWFIRPSSPMRTRAAPLFALLAAGMGVFSPAEAEAADTPVLRPLLAAAEPLKKADPAEAEKALKEGNFKQAAELYGRLLKQKQPESVRYRYAQALGYSAHKVQDFDRSVTGFSEALESPEASQQVQAFRGLGHTLYDQGDKAAEQQPKFAVKVWRDSLRHFNAALEIDPENKDLQENRDFVKKRLQALQAELDAKEQQGQKGQKGKKQKGQKGQKGEEGEEGEEDGETGENGDKEKDGEGDKDRSRKESLGKQKGDKKEEEIPEGAIQPGNKGEPKDKQGMMKEGEGDEEAHEATGFSRNEARSFLRTYADDQKKAQIVRPRDPAANGKDW